MARKNPAAVANPYRPGEPLNRAETCTTEGCDQPRIRLNALKCKSHELVYRAAAKARAQARKAAAKAAEAATPAKPPRKSPVRAMGSGPVARTAAPAAAN